MGVLGYSIVSLEGVFGAGEKVGWKCCFLYKVSCWMCDSYSLTHVLSYLLPSGTTRW
jgi:hypothetical protein